MEIHKSIKETENNKMWKIQTDKNRKKQWKTDEKQSTRETVCVCVSLYVSEKESVSVSVWVCVCVCVRVRAWVSEILG